MPRLILGFFVLLFLVGAGYFVATHNRTTSSTVTTNTPTVLDNPATEQGTLRALLGIGESSQCTFTSNLPDGSTNVGTIFAADGRVKVDSVITDEAGVQSLSFIDDGDYYYSWGTNAEGTFAVKMPRQDTVYDETDSEASNDFDDESNTPFDYEQEMEYECSTWIVDESQFIPPSNIDFVDMSAMMESMMQNSGEFDASMLDEIEAMMQQ
jgi:hypothetical protein